MCWLFVCVYTRVGDSTRHIFYCGLRSEWFGKHHPESRHIRSSQLDDAGVKGKGGVEGGDWRLEERVLEAVSMDSGVVS